jgi:molybdate transport repressor ModE-like protein
MHQVTIKPQWTIRPATGPSLAPRLLELLVKVHEHGSLSGACKALGVSYRHAWELVRQGEALFGQALMVMERGKGSLLTPLGDKLVWADRRIAARLTPVLDSLASELEAEIGKLLKTPLPLLRIHASHGFAVQALHHFLGAAEVANDLRYCGGQEALASLLNGNCDVAGFHVPVGEFEPAAVAHYRPWLAAESQKLIHVATRRMGLIVAPNNPLKIYSTADLVRPGVRFINRQPGSGTRFLLDLQLQRDGVPSADILGYEQVELTHAAVAAFVASGMADVGYGVETPARQFKLDFVQNQTERYFLLFNEAAFGSPTLQRMLEILRSDAFRDAVNALPGYTAIDSGAIADLNTAFPTLGAPAPGGRRRNRSDPLQSAFLPR